MYNRYIPQADGTYRKNRVPDSHPPVPPREHPLKKKEDPPPCPPPKQEPCQEQPVKKPPKAPPAKQQENAFSFLRSLLPKDIDTGDLLIILLLLLMSADCAEDHNTALLTLALYLFM